MISGDSVLVRRGEDEVIDLLRKGQGVLNILPLAGVKEDLDATIVELFPAVGGNLTDDQDHDQAIGE